MKLQLLLTLSCFFIALKPTLCSPLKASHLTKTSSEVTMILLRSYQTPSEDSSTIVRSHKTLSTERRPTLSGPASRSSKTNSTKRRRRYDYEDVYEWDDDDDSLNYEFEEVEEPSLLLKIANNWRQAGIRLVFLGSFVIMILMICFGVCHLGCKLWCQQCRDHACCGSPYLKQCCQYLYTDPMYEKVKDLGEMFGIKISYAMYEKIKDHYIDDSVNQDINNPLGIY